MSKYNQIMNLRMIDASSNLSTELLHLDRGAFFKSMIGTLNHILIGDILWLKRFANHTKSYASLTPARNMDNPKSLDAILFDDLDSFKEERTRIDSIIIEWCKELVQDDLDDYLTYKNFKGEAHSKRFGDLILHVFLHQVHHRGQLTTLFSQAGIEFGETDLPEFVSDK